MHCAYAIAVEEIDDIERVAIQDDVHWLARLATNKARIQGNGKKSSNNNHNKFAICCEVDHNAPFLLPRLTPRMDPTPIR